jgi:hypothetical protein
MRDRLHLHFGGQIRYLTAAQAVAALCQRTNGKTHHTMLPGALVDRGRAGIEAAPSGRFAPVPQRRAAQSARAGSQARGERAATRPAGQGGQRIAEAPVQVPRQLALQRRALCAPARPRRHRARARAAT